MFDEETFLALLERRALPPCSATVSVDIQRMFFVGYNPCRGGDERSFFTTWYIFWAVRPCSSFGDGLTSSRWFEVCVACTLANARELRTERATTYI